MGQLTEMEGCRGGGGGHCKGADPNGSILNENSVSCIVDVAVLSPEIIDARYRPPSLRAF
jgi:hypothetical protein